jgi:hypothetical protein
MTRIPQLHQPKVYQHRLPIGANDHVLRLDVPVDDSLAVTVRQSAQQLIGPLQHLFLRQSALPLNAMIQTLTLDEVHHQVSVAAFFKEVGHPHQMRMVQAGQDHSLLLELLAQLGQSLGIQTRLGHHLLQRHHDVKTHIPSTINRPHTPLPQQGYDTVATL